MKGSLFIVLFTSIRIVALCQAECATATYRQEMLRNSPRAALVAEAIEVFIKNHLDNKTPAGNANGSPTAPANIINIPVVVHIVYNSPDQNISDAQVLSQINVLNKDYSRQNADTNNTPVVFRRVAANCGFQFALARVDSLGYATSGIIRRHTNIMAFSISDEIKFSNQGGDDGWDPNNYLNIWVGNLTGGILGYSSLLGGAADRDGVVVLYTAFGTQGTAKAPFNGGRTATHEIGHWLNLIHTWGDAACGDDHVNDTPPQETADRGCPDGTTISCNNGPNGDMYMNFMDFTNDDCMNLFTQGQRDRMQALFAPGGPRYNLLFSNSLTAVPKASQNLTTPPDNGGLIDLFPNPAIDQIMVAIPELESGQGLLEIYNDLGQKLMIIQLNQPQQSINISALKRGIYLVNIVSGKNRRLAKLVKI
jgi:hypothetical protein